MGRETVKGSRDESLPLGLVLFPRRMCQAVRRRRLVFLGIFCLVALGLVWPVYPLVSRIFPLLLGLPLSFAWVVLGLLVMFGALLWLYIAGEGP